MMNLRSSLSLVLATTALYFGLSMHSRAEATLFGARNIAESKAVAIAVPLNDGQSYNLVILEQLNNQRQCWREQGNQPTVIDPLLLNFDFTNICSRSTDSNGYSVRLGNEDMAWRYDLRLVFESNELKLKAFSTNNSGRSPIEVGRTRGLANGSLKIHLNEGWSFAKRTYEGKTLGHIYMVNNQSANQLVANNSAPSHRGNNTRFNSSNRYPEQIIETEVERQSSTPQNRSNQGNNSVQIFVAPPTEPQAIAIPSNPTVRNNNSVPIISSSASNNVPVPNRSIPTNNSDSSGYVQLNRVNTQPPPAPISLAQSLGLRYKVVVNATSNRQKDNLRAIVPDAFHTWVGDRRLMQAGAFVDEIEAQELQTKLQNAGFNSQVISIR